MALKGFFASVIVLLNNMLQCTKNFFKMLTPRSATALDVLLEKLQRNAAIVFMLVSFAILMVQIFGQPIACTLKTEHADATERVNDHCWYTDYFRFPRNSGLDRTTEHQARYQWVPLILLIHGSIFLLTFGACRGIRWLIEARWRRRKSHDYCRPGRCLFTPEYRLFLLCSHVISLWYDFVQLQFADKFLGGSLSRYGFGIFCLTFLEQSTRNDAMLTVFPQAIQCLVDNDGQMNSEAFCTVPINALNETIFDVVYLWFVIIGCIFYVSICIDISLLVSIFKNRRPCHISVMENECDPEDAMMNEGIELDVFTHVHNKPSEASLQVNHDKEEDALLPVVDDLP